MGLIHLKDPEADHLPPSGTSTNGRLLVIAYYFPPMGLSGVLRVSKFCKYLRTLYGWDVTVLTVGDVGYFAYDYSLLEEVLESGIVVERTRTLDPLSLFRKKGTIALPRAGRRRFLSGISHTFLQPDNKIGWKRFALRRAEELLSQSHFDVILSSAPPFTSFLIGAELQRRHGIPLVVDYRDPWLENVAYYFATPMHRRYAASLEAAVLKRAEGVVVVNRRIKEQLVARYPFLTHESVHIIPSGYDPADFKAASRFPLERSGRFRITFSGISDVHQTPKTFFGALAKLFARRPDLRDEIEVVFVGSFHASYHKMAHAMGVASSIVATGYVDHTEAIRYLFASDVLWLSAVDPAVTPGKVHEYIGTGKPILALCPPGVLRQVLREYGAAVSLDVSDVDGVTAALATYVEQWRAGTLPKGNADMAREYDQRNLVGRLARILAYSVRI